MSEPPLKSTLDPNGLTFTPTQVVQYARSLGDEIRRRIGDVGLSAHILPDEFVPALVVKLANKSGRRATLTLEIGYEYILNWNMAAQFWVTVPDFAEAMHFLGIVLRDVGADVRGVGLRSCERNPEVLARTIQAGQEQGQMDRCNRNPMAAVQDQPRSPTCYVSAERTFTAKAVFDWACSQVLRIEAFNERPSRIQLLVCRRPGGKAASWDGLPVAQPEVKMVLQILYERSSRITKLNFSLGDAMRLDGAKVTVTSLMHALHMAGMLIDGLEPADVIVGCCENETNQEVLADPLAPRHVHGRMIRPSNLVMGLLREA